MLLSLLVFLSLSFAIRERAIELRVRTTDEYSIGSYGSSKSYLLIVILFSPGVWACHNKKPLVRLSLLSSRSVTCWQSSITFTPLSLPMSPRSTPRRGARWRWEAKAFACLPSSSSLRTAIIKLLSAWRQLDRCRIGIGKIVGWSVWRQQ